MYIEDTLIQLGSSAIAGVVTAVGGVVAAILVERFRRQQTAKKLELDQIIEAARADDDVTEAITKPDLTHHDIGLDKHRTYFQRQYRTEPSPSTTESTDAVEGLISGYHEQALSQARAQFWFSVVAATVGFGWILYAGTDIRPDNVATALKTVPGIVMDAVAFLFFRQASETRQRATDLYDRLRKDKQTAASVALVSSIEDMRVRSAVKAQIALHMAGLDPNPIDLSNFLSSSGRTDSTNSSPDSIGNSNSS